MPLPYLLLFILLIKGATLPGAGRGLHASAYFLNVSALYYGIRGDFIRDCLRGVQEVLRGIRECLGCVCVSETAQVELKSGRV